MRTRQAQRPWRRRLLYALLGCGLPSLAFAQAPVDDTEIIVTGTRIARPDATSASPIVSFDAQAVAAHGAVQLEEFLNTLPLVSPDFSRTANNPGDGSARVNLRGLGANRTLSLLNGRRLAPAGTTGAADINALPAALIARIDVVTGGASAVYGSDAVAGVVNFITRTNVEGAEISAQADVYGAGDGQTYNVSALWGGHGLDRRAHVVAYADYLERRPVLQGARSFTRQSIGEDPFTGQLVIGGSPMGPNGAIPPPIGRVFEADGSLRPFNLATDFYNFAPDNYLQTPLTRWSVGTLARVELGPNLSASVELMYASPHANTQLAPGTFNAIITVPIDASFFSSQAREFLAANFDPDGDGLANFRLSRRLVEVGPRQRVSERDYYRAAFGLRRTLASAEWRFDYTYARNDKRDVLVNDASISRIRQGILVNPATGQCQDRARNCVPVNLFGPGNLSAEAADFIRLEGITERTEIEQQTATFALSADVVQAPAGAVRVVFGGEWRRLSTIYAPSPVLFTGDAAGFLASQPVAGTIETLEAFAEALAPITTRLEVEAGLRVSDYSNAGAHWTWKYGLQWRLTESLRLRAMGQRAVRAPNVRELFEAPSLGFNFVSPLSDFCTAANNPIGRGFANVCTAQGMAASQIGVYDLTGQGYITDFVTRGNPALTPETADTLTAGAEWVFGAPWRARVSLDYFNIELEDAILAMRDPFAACAVARDPRDRACQLITRDTNGFVTEFRAVPLNYARAQVEGVDLGVNVAFNAPEWLALWPGARFEFDLRATHYLESSSALSDSAASFDCVGYFGCGSYDLHGAVTPEHVATTSLLYRAGPGTVQVRWRYIAGARNADAAQASAAGLPAPLMAIKEIDAVHYMDLALGFDLGRARLSAGVDNVFEADPPLLASNQVQANTDPARYDVFGRRFFVRLSYRL